MSLEEGTKLRSEHFRFLGNCPTGSGHGPTGRAGLRGIPGLSGAPSEFPSGCRGPKLRRKGPSGALRTLAVPKPWVGQHSPPPLTDEVSALGTPWPRTGAQESCVPLTSLSGRGSNPGPATSCLGFPTSTSSRADLRAVCNLQEATTHRWRLAGRSERARLGSPRTSRAGKRVAATGQSPDRRARPALTPRRRVWSAARLPPPALDGPRSPVGSLNKSGGRAGSPGTRRPGRRPAASLPDTPQPRLRPFRPRALGSFRRGRRRWRRRGGGRAW